MKWYVIYVVALPALCALAYVVWLPTDSDTDLQVDARQADNNSSAVEFEGLDEEVQQRVRDLEHYTFELEWKFDVAFCEALKNHNHDELSQFFQESFSGRISAQVSEETDNGWWRQMRVHSTAVDPSNSPAVDTRELITHLLDRLEDFDEVRKVKLRVLAIGSAEETHHWRLQLLLSVFGRSADNGPVSYESWHNVDCQFRDEDDIATGRIITSWDVESEVTCTAPLEFINEVTQESGLSGLHLHDNWKAGEQQKPQYNTMQIGVSDFDLDGYLDIAISSHNRRQCILRSRGGQGFEDVTRKPGLPLQ